MVTIEVEGMSCGHCASTITKAIASLDPAAKVEVDLAARQVKVDGTAGADRIRAAIREAGYEPLD